MLGNFYEIINYVDLKIYYTNNVLYSWILFYTRFHKLCNLSKLYLGLFVMRTRSITLITLYITPLQHKFTSVIHTAGLKVIGESCDEPLLYYRVNVCGTINLIEVSIYTLRNRQDTGRRHSLNIIRPIYFDC